jgi:hypothetical protein
MKTEKISTFKVKITEITSQHIRFRLYSGYGLYKTHALSQSLESDIVLEVQQFEDFILRLVAFTYIERDLTDKEIIVVKKMKNIIIFNNYDPLKAEPILIIKKFKKI